MLIALQKYASTRNLNDEKWYKWWSNRVDFECFRCDVRIPVQSCHLFQTNAATHSISKLPLIPVNVATL
jgi:hypothetical protein